MKPVNVQAHIVGLVHMSLASQIEGYVLRRFMVHENQIWSQVWVMVGDLVWRHLNEAG